jgi:hypothetical protein
MADGRGAGAGDGGAANAPNVGDVEAAGAGGDGLGEGALGGAGHAVGAQGDGDVEGAGAGHGRLLVPLATVAEKPPVTPFAALLAPHANAWPRASELAVALPNWSNVNPLTERATFGTGRSWARVCKAPTLAASALT